MIYESYRHEKVYTQLHSIGMKKFMFTSHKKIHAHFKIIGL